jgi:hypothetical protein
MAVATQETYEEVSEHFGSRVIAQFVATDAVDLIALERELAVLRHIEA